MYRSVGKLLRSLTSRRRSGASSAAIFSAAESTLNRLTEVLSVQTSSPGCAPTRPASLSPRRCGRSNQPALFQARISCVPHSSVTAAAMRAGAAAGITPSELPSR